MVVSAPERDVVMPGLDSHRVASALDAHALAKLTRLDPSGQSGLVKRVMTAYRASLARLRQDLDGLLHDPDLARLSMAAHTLKSSSASVGALHLSSLCASIEQAARRGLMDGPDGRAGMTGMTGMTGQAGLAGLVGRLKVEIDRVDQAVQHMIANPASHA